MWALDGMLVLDFTQQMAGPFCTMLLGDMGADVIKVEKPEGDDIRRAGPPFINGESAAFLSINRNKRSLVLDLKKPEAVDVIRHMTKKADVLVQNMRPGIMTRLGLGYEDLSEINPALVYCSISGFGSTGPYATRPGFDLVAQGMSGLMSLTGMPGGPPLRNGVPIADLNAGIYATYAILSAYIHRLKTRRGQHIDTSLLEASLAYTIWESAIYFATNTAPGPVGTAHPIAAPYQAFSSIDGHFIVGAANQANWVRLCQAIGREELLDDERFSDNANRMKNLDILSKILQDIFLTATTADWLNILDNAGVPSGPINDLAAAYCDPQVQARCMTVELDHPTAGPIRNIGIPVKMSATPGTIRRSSPTLGEHIDEILTECGYPTEEICELRRRGVLG